MSKFTLSKDPQLKPGEKPVIMDEKEAKEEYDNACDQIANIVNDVSDAQHEE